MRPYINRDYTIRMMRITAQRQEDSFCEPEIKAFCRNIWDRAISVVRHESGNDVVPVVRCKKCKWGYFFPGTEFCLCNKPILCNKPYAAPRETHMPDWYCADGKRKEDEYA